MMEKYELFINETRITRILTHFSNYLSCNASNNVEFENIGLLGIFGNCL